MNSKPICGSVIRISLGITIFLFAVFSTLSAAAGEIDSQKETSILVSPLTLYQSTISRADGPRCPMYPSCSHYAAQAMERHGKLLGWLLTADRLLRCGRDETRRAPKVMVNGHLRTYDPLEANTFWWSSP